MSEAVWSLMKPEDIPELVAMHERQGMLLGKSMPFPDPMNVPIFQTAICRKHGRMVGALLFEAEVEIQAIADGPEFLKELSLYQSTLEQGLRIRGYKAMRAFVPRHAVDVLDKGRQRLRSGFYEYMKHRGFVSTEPAYLSYLRHL